ncbi:MAG: carbamate kinase [Bacteriovoracaceae bacterium]|nr:carbamate kinase [Bacteriovoracaceae bacterium]
MNKNDKQEDRRSGRLDRRKCESNKPSILIAFGGNALNVKSLKKVHQKEEFIVARRSMENVVDLLEMGYSKIILTHGNGPQVGRIFLQQELTKDEFPRQLTLDVCVADSQGRIGYILQNCFDNICYERGINKKTSTIITQVLVDKKDPAFKNPSKPIGVFYSESDAKDLIKKRGWIMKKDAEDNWRRVVPSPMPLEIIETRKFELAMDHDFIAIGCGGGGIPVIRNNNGELRGVEAVIDKDRTSALLAYSIGIDILIILTNASSAYLNFNTPDQKSIKKTTVSEIEKFLNEGHFSEGSMGPKIEAAISFMKNGGKKAIIANLFDLTRAIKGRVGTQIHPDPAEDK